MKNGKYFEVYCIQKAAVIVINKLTIKFQEMSTL